MLKCDSKIRPHTGLVPLLALQNRLLKMFQEVFLWHPPPDPSSSSSSTSSQLALFVLVLFWTLVPFLQLA